jgi:hypothetical protein
MRAIAECGTDGGYQRHIRLREEPCEACRMARRDYMRDLRARSPHIRAGDQVDTKVKNRALWRLAREYPQRFNQLVDEERARLPRITVI